MFRGPLSMREINLAVVFLFVHAADHLGPAVAAGFAELTDIAGKGFG